MNNLVKTAAALVTRIAEKGAGAASVHYWYEPQVPQELLEENE